ncbi:MAG: hypothetical protein H6815_09890 [Phycisphaeraceae bacterium]|nr:hypothetical protein [Phycisphaerales bacterium]MCB9860748.1 hypothetical protein [Phycisphaeraceae bacterium]
MNRLAFVIAVWVLLGLELGVKDVVTIRLPASGPGLSPSILVPFGMFICLGAKPRVGIIACLIIGLLMDLTFIMPMSTTPPRTFVMIGPYALGMALGAQLAISMRDMLIIRNPLSVAFLSVCASLVMHVVVVAIFSMHRIYGDPIHFDTFSELFQRALASLYTGIFGFLLAYILYPLAPTLGLNLGPRSSRRG